MFADDTTVYREIKSDDDNTKLQEDMTELENWQTSGRMHGIDSR